MYYLVKRAPLSDLGLEAVAGANRVGPSPEGLFFVGFSSCFRGAFFCMWFSLDEWAKVWPGGQACDAPFLPIFSLPRLFGLDNDRLFQPHFGVVGPSTLYRRGVDIDGPFMDAITTWTPRNWALDFRVCKLYRG